MRNVLVPLSLSLLLAASCGRHHKNKSVGATDVDPVTPAVTAPETPVITPETQPNGNFEATLTALNTKYSKAKGIFLFSANDEVKATLKARGLYPFTHYQQYLLDVSECPSLEKNDKNADGVIDMEEVITNAEGSLPLDLDLNSAESGMGYFPQSNLLGAIDYQEVASAENFFESMDQSDIKKKNPADKVVMLLGVSRLARLPLTAKGWDGQDAHATFPIACGKIKSL